MLRTINLQGYSFQVDHQDLINDFRKMHPGFMLMNLKLNNDIYFPDSDTEIIATCQPFSNPVNLKGFDIRTICFVDNYFVFHLSPHRFRCIQEKLKAEILTGA